MSVANRSSVMSNKHLCYRWQRHGHYSDNSHVRMCMWVVLIRTLKFLAEPLAAFLNLCRFDFEQKHLKFILETSRDHLLIRDLSRLSVETS